MKNNGLTREQKKIIRNALMVLEGRKKSKCFNNYENVYTCLELKFGHGSDRLDIIYREFYQPNTNGSIWSFEDGTVLDASHRGYSTLSEQEARNIRALMLLLFLEVGPNGVAD